MTANELMPTELHPRRGEPTWVVARMFPSQGNWTEEAFSKLPDNRGLELVEGVVEVLPVPKKVHQRIVRFLLRLLEAYLDKHPIGELFVTGYKARIRPGTLREPDILLVLHEHAATALEDYADQVDLAVEVVSPDNPKRDYVDKRADYAAAGIGEYWIIDSISQRVTVLVLKEGSYVEQCVCGRGQTATSPLLPGLQLDVSAVLDAYSN